MKNKYIKFIIATYVALQLLGVLIYYVAPMDGFIEGKSETKDHLETLKLRDELVPQKLKEKFLDGSLPGKNYNFNFDGREIQINFENKQDMIFFERKTTDDNKIEVYWYCGSAIVNNMDLSFGLKGPNIKLENNKLNIKYEEQNFSYVQFSKDMFINQFYKKDNISEEGFVGRLGNGLIYIKVPKSIQVTGEKEYEFIIN